ncbi:hypothetical protein C9374_009875 [Naegleria lovaniensis]|uniref:Cytochrome c-type biogenesis protein CcmE n=1 Tax=Naegleria lovaniensis TaxID=51637 RepID=A0AA88GGN8_NAELO|nr:uncharacterized protein C9374_009875 [Naegleria lovaniensis]KAG2375252.1 hypothetical protein C9374_009875 [Naegleria lovaniensis]
MKKLCAIVTSSRLKTLTCSSSPLSKSSLVVLWTSSSRAPQLFLNSYRNFQTTSNHSTSNEQLKEKHDNTVSTPSSEPMTPATHKNVISEEEEPTTSNQNNQRNSHAIPKRKIISSSSSPFKKLSKTLLWVVLTTVGAVIIFLIYEINSERLDYYVSPTKIIENREEFPPDRKIRVGGVVKEDSVRHLSDINLLTCFTITDLKHDIEIEYKGILPDLFEENSTVVCEGFMVGHNKLKCTNVLAKHDQRNGMPPEIAYEVEKNRRELERKKLYEEQMLSGDNAASK